MKLIGSVVVVSFLAFCGQAFGLSIDVLKIIITPSWLEVAMGGKVFNFSYICSLASSESTIILEMLIMISYFFRIIIKNPIPKPTAWDIELDRKGIGLY